MFYETCLLCDETDVFHVLSAQAQVPQLLVLPWPASIPSSYIGFTFEKKQLFHVLQGLFFHAHIMLTLHAPYFSFVSARLNFFYTLNFNFS